MPHSQTPLPKYWIEKNIELLDLKPALKKRIETLIEIPQTKDSKFNVAQILDELYPESDLKSANTMLGRLIKQINSAAEEKGLSFRVHITPSKKAGAKNRWLWFEGELPAPDPAYMPELDRVGEERAIKDQKGVLPMREPTVILLTVNANETEAVKKIFIPGEKIKIINKNGKLYNLLGKVGPLQIVHTTCEQGPLEAQKVCTKAISDFEPVAIVGVGIAFGLQKDKQKLGDVLVSKTIQGYEHKKLSRDGARILRGPKPEASAKLFDIISNLYKSDGHGSENWPRLHFGNILSGATLYDHQPSRDELLKIDPEAIGGEMEGIGIYKAAHDRKIDWIVIKGISDWGDGTKSGKSEQSLAARNAAFVTQKLLEVLASDHNVMTCGQKPSENQTPGPET